MTDLLNCVQDDLLRKQEHRLLRFPQEPLDMLPHTTQANPQYHFLVAP